MKEGLTPAQKAFGKIGLPSIAPKPIARIDIIRAIHRRLWGNQANLLAQVRHFDRDSAITARIPDELMPNMGEE